MCAGVCARACAGMCANDLAWVWCVNVCTRVFSHVILAAGIMNAHPDAHAHVPGLVIINDFVTAAQEAYVHTCTM